MSVLERGLQLLDCLAEAGESGVMELARRINVDPSQAHRALRILQEQGYVQQDKTSKKYRLSHHIVELASSHLSRLDIRREARLTLTELATSTTFNAHLAVLSLRHAVIIDQVRGTSTVSVNVMAGDVALLHATALGKALLAYLDSGELDAMMPEIEFERLTSRTISTVDALRTELDRIRKRGYAIDDEEAYRGVRCVASPVFNWAGEVEATIGVAGPAWDITPDVLEVLGRQVLKASRELSRNLGYTSMQDGAQESKRF